jgi:uncharacterized protein
MEVLPQNLSVPANVTVFPIRRHLLPNTVYYYRVRALNIVGDSAYSNDASAVTASGGIPAAPSNLAAVAVSGTAINLYWSDNSNNETGFRIERRISGAYSQVATVGVNVTTYADSGLTPGTKYEYRVMAYNNEGDSSYSNVAEATTHVVVPAAPSDLTVTAVTANSISLSWYDNSNNETGFKIERRTANTNYTQVATVGANVTTYTNTGLSNNTTYYYRVKAYNNSGDSVYTNIVNATTTNLPAAPTNLVVTSVTTNRINLAWTDNATNESGFKIERKTAGGSYSQIATVGANVTSYSSTSLSNNTTYYYRVRAYNSYGNSGYSDEVGATTGGIPTAPTGLTFSGLTQNSVTLSWTDNAQNEEGYRIERRTAGGSYTQVATVDKNVTTYTNTGLSSSTTYYYRVRAYNLTGNSSYSNEITFTTMVAGAPVNPTTLTATALSNTSIQLAWKDNATNETGFKIERKPVGGSFTQIATVSSNATTFIDTGLSAATTYTYRVRAYNATANSGYSNEASVSTMSTITVRLTIGSYTYSVNNQQLSMDTSPIITEGRTLLPIRYVAEAIGATVEWNASQQKSTVRLGDKIIELWIGNNIAKVNGVSKAIDPANSKVKPIIVPPGRIMLPVRFIVENLGCRIDYYSTTKEVRVTYPAP